MTRKLIDIDKNRLMVKLLKMAKERYLLNENESLVAGKHSNICSAVTSANMFIQSYANASLYERANATFVTHTIQRSITQRLGVVAYFSTWWERHHGKGAFEQENRPLVQRDRHIWLDRMIRTYERRIKKWEKANAKAG